MQKYLGLAPRQKRKFCIISFLLRLKKKVFFFIPHVQEVVLQLVDFSKQFSESSLLDQKIALKYQWVAVTPGTWVILPVKKVLVIILSSHLRGVMSEAN